MPATIDGFLKGLADRGGGERAGERGRAAAAGAEFGKGLCTHRRAGSYGGVAGVDAATGEDVGLGEEGLGGAAPHENLGDTIALAGEQSDAA